MSKMIVAINGFGRIGRCVLRAYFQNNEDFINEFVINSTLNMEDSLHLLKYDSTFGRVNFEIDKIGENSCKINGILCKFVSQRDINLINWKGLKIDLVMECTGKFLTSEALDLHLKSGAKKVILSAPSKSNDIKTIIFGVNESNLNAQDNIISIGSCTTNCLAPIVKILQDNFSIISGFATTIHAYTGDQNLLDNSHKDKRRARAAAMSIIPTSSGVSSALGAIFPDLRGKIDGSAIRVPVNNVSSVDFVVNIEEKVDIEIINNAFIKANKENPKIVGISNEPLVSRDFLQTRESAIIDLLETRITNENCVRILAWYDNEWGFSCRMLDMAKILDINSN